jgi:ubiquinone/menaquinone biosynthesis C-methylase UbiE
LASSKFINRIGSVYDKIAPIYDIWGKLTESHARNRGIELAEIVDGQSILEVAVGTGLAFYEKVAVREYYQQMLFPSEVILAYR